MNDALREAAQVDPDWAKKEGRRQMVLKATVAGTLLALAFGTVAFVLGVHNSREITKVKTRVEHSACQVKPAGAECQRTKAAASRAANLYVTCIPFHKAGYPCPRPGSVANPNPSKSVQGFGRGGGVQHHSSKSHQHPSPSSKGGSGKGGVGKGGSDGPTAPGKGGGGSAPPKGGSNGQPSREPPAPPASGDAKPQQPVLPATVEATGKAAGEVVGKTGEAVQGVVEDIGDAGCLALGKC